MAIANVHNDQQLVRAFAGTETTAGTAVTPTFPLLGAFQLTKTRALSDIASYAGTYMSNYTPVYGPTDLGGSYGQPLTFEAFATLPRYALAASPTPVSDGAVTPGYTRTFNHNTASRLSDAMTVIHGFKEMPFVAAGVRLPAFNINCDVDATEAAWVLNVPTLYATSDDLYMYRTGTATAATTTTVTTGVAATLNAYALGWIHIIKGTGAGQAREIVSNTAPGVYTVSPAFSPAPDNTSVYILTGPMPAISIPDYETINAESTQTFIDDYTGGTIGTTDDSARVISWNVGFEWPVLSKRFQGSTAGGYDAKTGNGPIVVAGSIRMEFDSPKEYKRFVDRGLLKIRHKQVGSIIDTATSTRKLAQIDVFRAALEAPTWDFRNSNQTINIPYRGYVDSVEGIYERLVSKTALATLP